MTKLNCTHRTVTGLTVLLAASGLSAQTTAPAATPALTAAVLDFAAAVPGLPDLGPQIGETLTALLGDESGLRLVDRAGLARTLQEHELSLTGLAKPEDAVRVGQLVGAKILITGRAFVLDDTLFVTAKIIGTETSRVDGVLVKGKAAAGITDLLPQLSEKVAAKARETGPRLVAAPEPADPIPALKARLANRTLPRLSIGVAEVHFGEARRAVDPAVETELRLTLQGLGFEVADAATTQPVTRPADVMLTGEAFSEFAARIGNLVTCSARAEVKAKDANGRLLWSDRVTTRAADLSEQIAGKAALQKAGRELAVRIAGHYAADQAGK